jgi:hypothetical protein
MSSKAEAPANSERTTMTHVTIERAKLEQLLEALNSPAYGKELRELQDKAITVAKQALAQPVQEPDAASLFREALGFGWIYGPLIPAHQWNEMSEEKVAQLVARLATPPAQPAPVPTNCRHCGGPDNVLCGGQCKAAQPAPVTTREIDP